MKPFPQMDSSAKLLLISNLLTLVLAVAFQWSVLTLLFGYWLQSLIIGVFTIPKILLAGFGQKDSRWKFGSILLVVFFIFHYGMFHLLYGIFLMAFSTFNFFGPVFRPVDVSGVLYMGVIFLATHFFSFVKNYLWDRKGVEADPTLLFIGPYMRVIPMHVSIIAGGFLMFLFPVAETGFLIVFLALKTWMDIKGHEMLHSKDVRFKFGAA